MRPSSFALSSSTMSRHIAIGSALVRVDDDQPTFWDRVAAGAWEPETIAAYEAETGPGTFVVDLGAWVGPLAILAAVRGARVLAVEADPAALDQLRRNLAANPDLASRVDVLARAVAADTGPVRLGARRKPGDSMSSVLLAGGATAWNADGVTPASLLAARRPGERVFVKLDIEGGEYALLPSLWPLLREAGATLLLSLHPEFLRESGEADPAGRGMSALAGAAGWPATRLDRPREASGPPTREELSTASTWLFRPPS